MPRGYTTNFYTLIISLMYIYVSFLFPSTQSQKVWWWKGCTLYTWTRKYHPYTLDPLSSVKQIPSENLCQDLIIIFTLDSLTHHKGPDMVHVAEDEAKMLLKLSNVELPNISKVKKEKNP